MGIMITRSCRVCVEAETRCVRDTPTLVINPFSEAPAPPPRPLSPPCPLPLPDYCYMTSNSL